jgi:hypothetical protein
MHRTHLAGLLAVALPFAVSAHWLLAAPLALGLWITRSVTGIGAALVGLVVLRPTFIGLALWLAVVAVWMRHRRPPGALTDTTRARLLSWHSLLRDLSWRGHGSVRGRLGLAAAHIRSDGRAMDGGPARNEPLELVYEYGLPGVLAVAAVLACAVTIWRPRWHDPVTAAAASAAVVVCGTSPFRAFGAWLRGGRDGPLFGPPLRASLTLHLDAQGNAHLYGAAVNTTNRTLQIEIARALFNLGHGWMQQHEIRVEEVSHEPPIRLRFLAG